MDDSDPDIEDISATLANQVVSQCNTNEQCNTTNVDTPEIVRKVESDTSPFFYAFYNHHPCRIVIDTGATSSVISRSFLQTIGISPNVTQHSARGADKNHLNVEGEIELTLNLGELKLPITALVLDSLDCDILAGIPFCKVNDIQIHLRSVCMYIGDLKIPYGAKSKEGKLYLSS